MALSRPVKSGALVPDIERQSSFRDEKATYGTLEVDAPWSRVSIEHRAMQAESLESMASNNRTERRAFDEVRGGITRSLSAQPAPHDRRKLAF